MSMQKVIDLYQDYHWPAELVMMNRLADGVFQGVIVAIGSYRGQMDSALALNSHVPVYCVDPREAPGTHYGDVDRPYWMRNILAIGVGEKVRPVNLPSLQAAAIWNQPISLLFVDGNHDEVMADLNAWLPHVWLGALVALHDNNFPQVIKAIEQSTDLVEIERADRTTVFRKTRGV